MRTASWVVLALALGAMLFSRKPAALLRPELWGDEGWSFYPDAYRLGLGCLLVPAGGYLDSFQRLAALLVQPLPLHLVPLAFAVIAFGVQLSTALFLCTDRFAAVIPSRVARVALAAATLAAPNVLEWYVNLTNTQWTLALLALAIVTTPPTGRLALGIADGLLLALSGLSGPFGLFLLPVAIWQWGRFRDRETAARLAVVAVTGVIQLAVLLLVAHPGRSAAPLGAGPRMLAQVLAAQVVVPSVMGAHAVGLLQATAWWRNSVVPMTACLVAAGVVMLALWRGGTALRQAGLFTGLMLVAALLTPQVSLSAPRWEVMTHLPMGNRYFEMPILFGIASMISLAADRDRRCRALGVVLLSALVLVAIPADWHILRFAPTDFQQRARRFEAAPPGTRMSFPIVPTGLSPMELVKH